MSVQFLVNGIHPDGTPGLVPASRNEWLEIVARNMDLPPHERRVFFRDLIVDGGEYDYLIMEVPRKLFNEWENESRAFRRNMQAKKAYSHLSYDELDEQGLCESIEFAAPVCVEDQALDSVFIDHLYSEISPKTEWAKTLLDMYIAGNSSNAQKYLIETLGIGRTTAYRYQAEFEFLIKKFLKKNETN